MVDARSVQFMKRAIADESLHGDGRDLASFNEALIDSSKLRRKRDCQADLAACVNRCDYPCLWRGCTAAATGCHASCHSAYHC
ncbi:unnamed protein product [Adineta ricciae]|uniref:Uncharacterized protein n=1 Tax=Adineta ricciae TaxID=249248 RepID=A0A815LEP4_ADIRI|nr:unnamed protein product [Adineta ricciae]CAF1408953.1 unnamed protein product [Adineta ricciae]